MNTSTTIAFSTFTATDSRGYVWATGRSVDQVTRGAKTRMGVEGVRGIKAAMQDLTIVQVGPSA